MRDPVPGWKDQAAGASRMVRRWKVIRLVFLPVGIWLVLKGAQVLTWLGLLILAVLLVGFTFLARWRLRRWQAVAKMQQNHVTVYYRKYNER